MKPDWTSLQLDPVRRGTSLQDVGSGKVTMLGRLRMKQFPGLDQAFNVATASSLRSSATSTELYFAHIAVLGARDKGRAIEVVVRRSQSCWAESMS